jgi:hypothetical protein
MTRAGGAKTRSRAMLALGDYIEEFNINPYTLAFIAYITTSKEPETIGPKAEIKPISIPKSRAQGLIEPKSHKEAVNSNFKDYWFKSESNELKTLENNNTWELVPKLEGVKVIYSR